MPSGRVERRSRGIKGMGSWNVQKKDLHGATKERNPLTESKTALFLTNVRGNSSEKPAFRQSTLGRTERKKERKPLLLVRNKMFITEGGEKAEGSSMLQKAPESFIVVDQTVLGRGWKGRQSARKRSKKKKRKKKYTGGRTAALIIWGRVPKIRRGKRGEQVYRPKELGSTKKKGRGNGQRGLPLTRNEGGLRLSQEDGRERKGE